MKRILITTLITIFLIMGINSYAQTTIEKGKDETEVVIKDTATRTYTIQTLKNEREFLKESKSNKQKEIDALQIEIDKLTVMINEAKALGIKE